MQLIKFFLFISLTCIKSFFAALFIFYFLPQGQELFQPNLVRAGRYKAIIIKIKADTPMMYFYQIGICFSF